MLNKYLSLREKARKMLNLTTFHKKLKGFESLLGLCQNLKGFATLYYLLRLCFRGDYLTHISFETLALRKAKRRL